MSMLENTLLPPLQEEAAAIRQPKPAIPAIQSSFAQGSCMAARQMQQTVFGTGEKANPWGGMFVVRNFQERALGLWGAHLYSFGRVLRIPVAGCGSRA
jgi:hypothetical protein